jgi:hypothetical protein
MGLRALDNPNGSHPKVKKYAAVSGVIYEGQLVLLNDGSFASPVATSAMLSAVKSLLGVATHHKPADAADGDSEVQVYIDPRQRYAIQANDGTLQAPTSYIGANFATINAELGSDSTGQASMELDGASGTSASVVSTTARPLRVIDLRDVVNNQVVSGSATDSSNAEFVVEILPKYHHFAGSGGVL